MNPVQIVIHPAALERVAEVIAAEDTPIEVLHWSPDGFTDVDGNEMIYSSPLIFLHGVTA